MSLFEKEESKSKPRQEEFPTEPAFTVPVEVRSMPQHMRGEGQKGVVALSPVPVSLCPCGDKILGLDGTIRADPSQITPRYLDGSTKDMRDDTERLKAKRMLLRQAFVLPWRQ